MVYNDTIKVNTKGFGDTIDITANVHEAVTDSNIQNGLVTIFCPGSTGTITTTEYEPGVIRDLQRALEKIVPSDIRYEHDLRWGDGNGFSHVKTFAR